MLFAILVLLSEKKQNAFLLNVAFIFVAFARRQF
jgi:hypothetical protein